MKKEAILLFKGWLMYVICLLLREIMIRKTSLHFSTIEPLFICFIICGSIIVLYPYLKPLIVYKYKKEVIE